MANDDHQLARHSVMLFEGDMNRLKELYPVTGASHAVRTLVRKHIEQVEAKAKEGQRTGPMEEIDVN